MTSDAYRFSSRSDDMDREQIHAWLSKEAYWALRRPRALQDAAIDASANFGMFDSMTGRQVAYARVVTDSVTLASLWLSQPRIRRILDTITGTVFAGFAVSVAVDGTR